MDWIDNTLAGIKSFKINLITAHQYIYGRSQFNYDY